MRIVGRSRGEEEEECGCGYGYYDNDDDGNSDYNDGVVIGRGRGLVARKDMEILMFTIMQN